MSVSQFSDPSIKQRLDLVQHLSEYADLLLLIQGAHGAGKTLLLKQLLERSRDHWMVCVIEANPLTTRDQLLSQFGHQLGLNLRDVDVSDLLGVIKERLTALQRAGRVVILIVDDAHALAVPVLDLLLTLFELRNDDAKLVRILLFAEPVIEETLRSPALRSLKQQFTHTLEIPPLTKEQVGSFLEHVFEDREYSGLFPLSSNLVQKAYELSGGIPGRLIEIADTLANEEAVAGTQEEFIALPKLKKLSRSQVLLIVGAITLVIPPLIFQDEINRFFEAEETSVVIADRPGSVALPIPSPKEPQSTKEVDVKAPVLEKLPLIEQPKAIDNKELEVLVRESANEGTTATPREISTNSETLTPKQQDANVVNPVSTELLQDEKSQGSGEKKVAQTDKHPEMLDHAWLMSRPGDHFTLQLLGVREESALLAFVRDNQLENKVAYLKTTHRGNAWHVLFYGDYQSREAAVANRDRLVQQLRGVKPWPRSFASIHEQLTR